MNKRSRHSKRQGNVLVNRAYKRAAFAACRVPNRAARRAVARIMREVEVVNMVASADTVLPS